MLTTALFTLSIEVLVVEVMHIMVLRMTWRYKVVSDGSMQHVLVEMTITCLSCKSGIWQQKCWLNGSYQR